MRESYYLLLYSIALRTLSQLLLRLSVTFAKCINELFGKMSNSIKL